MGRTITAVYENGVLRPLEPLQIPEHAHVEIDVRQVVAGDDRDVQHARVRQALADAGLLAEESDALVSRSPLTPEERARRAQELAASGMPSLSSAILDEREGR